MALTVQAYQRRDCDSTLTLTNADGTNATVSATDVVRVKIGTSGRAPILDLDDNATSNGSSVSAANPAALVLAAGDLTFDPGVYDLEVAVVDDSDSDKIKHSEKGILVLHRTQIGDVGLT